MVSNMEGKSFNEPQTQIIHIVDSKTNEVILKLPCDHYILCAHNIDTNNVEVSAGAGEDEAYKLLHILIDQVRNVYAKKVNKKIN